MALTNDLRTVSSPQALRYILEQYELLCEMVLNQGYTLPLPTPTYEVGQLVYAPSTLSNPTAGDEEARIVSGMITHRYLVLEGEWVYRVFTTYGEQLFQSSHIAAREDLPLPLYLPGMVVRDKSGWQTCRIVNLWWNTCYHSDSNAWLPTWFYDIVELTGNPNYILERQESQLELYQEKQN